jgi:hypothetical protein
VVKGKAAGPQRRPTSKLRHKNRWLISRDIVAHLRRAGVACNIIVPDRIALTQEGMSPGERATISLIRGSVSADDPKLEEAPEIAAAIRENKRLN